MLLSVAALLRLWGISSGLPYFLKPDETAFLDPPIHMAAMGTLEPGWFGHPGSTVLYPLLGLDLLYSRYLITTGELASLSALPVYYAAHPAAFALLGRGLMVLYAVLTIPVVFVLAAGIFNRRTAWFAAWLAAILPLHASYSQIVRTDVPQTFFLCLTALGSLAIYRRGRTLDYALAGLALGLATATKYSALFGFEFVLLAHVLARRGLGGKQGIFRLGAVLAIAVVTFFITSPYVLLDRSTAVHDMVYEARAVQPGADGLSPLGNFAWYVTWLLPVTMSGSLYALGVVGMVLLIRSRERSAWLLASLPILYLASISLHPMHWPRWAVPTATFLTIPAAYAVWKVVGWVQSLLPRMTLPMLVRTRPSWIVLSAFAVVSVWPLAATLKEDYRGTQPATWVVALDWITANVPAGTRVVTEPFGPALPSSRYSVEVIDRLADRTLATYREERVQLLIASSWVFGSYDAEPERYADVLQSYRELYAKTQLLQEFQPSPWQSGPTLRLLGLQNTQIAGPP